MADERTSYRERTPWPGWAQALLWGPAVLVCYPVLAGWDTDLPLIGRMQIVAGILAFTALLVLLLGGLTVEVRDTEILVHIGRARLIRRRVPYAEIRGVRSARYRPLRDFGGWGIRGFGKRKAWSARGDQAVVLELEGDRELFIGSDHPRRLEDRIRRAMERARRA